MSPNPSGAGSGSYSGEHSALGSWRPCVTTRWQAKSRSCPPGCTWRPNKRLQLTAAVRGLPTGQPSGGPSGGRRAARPPAGAKVGHARPQLSRDPLGGVGRKREETPIFSLNLPAAVVSVALFAVAVWSFLRGRRTARWPQVVADVTEVADRSAIDTAAFNAEPTLHVAFRAAVSYFVGGQRFSTTLDVDAPPGRHIVLAYNPRSPGQAIVPSSHESFGPSFVLFVLALLFGVAAVVW
jgi:hypothetical protein